VLLALAATAIFLLVLLSELSLPRARRAVGRVRRSVASARDRDPAPAGFGYDPGRELRAEQRARTLLRSCVNEEEWAMYRDLGFLRVWGGLGAGEGSTTPVARERSGEVSPDSPAATGFIGMGPAALGSAAAEPTAIAPYAYLIYPHEPIVAYLPQTGVLLNEYCVAFPDHTRPYGSPRLPDSDDVLAKWMALTADERRLISDANMHLPGRQIDPQRIRRDLGRLARWERERADRERRGAGSVSAP
jgi:hypothetical protein